MLENLCGEATRPRKKFDDIFICFDTIPAVTDRQTDRHVAVAKTALTERREGEKRIVLCTEITTMILITPHWLYTGPSCTICQFWLFAGQCKSIADGRPTEIYIFRSTVAI